MASYKETQRQRSIDLRDKLFRDPGDGEFRKIKREFVLSEPDLNLWSGIREDAIEYYQQNKISWWSTGNEPTGHLLSSQIACLNHLYFLRQRADLATAVLQGVDTNIKKAVKLDSGYVEFEKVGEQKLGGERPLTRGANCTSVDALMLGETRSGSLKLFLIEWKYTETYSPVTKNSGASGATRVAAYKNLLNHTGCPISTKNQAALYYEPFYQLMRQTLLGWQMVGRKEYKADSWMHLHIIPHENTGLKNTITAPGLIGNTICAAWKSVLNNPGLYQSLDPADFLQPISQHADTLAVRAYLKARYW
jgi:hypothetical protein